MVACFFSAAADVPVKESNHIAEVVCAEARRSPLVTHDHHVATARLGTKYLVTLRGVGADGEDVERHVLLNSLAELEALAPRLVEDPKTTAAPVASAPPPRRRVAWLSAESFAIASRAGVGGGLGLGGTGGGGVIAPHGDLRAALVGSLVLASVTVGARVRVLESGAFVGTGLGLGTITDPGISNSVRVPAYLEGGFDFAPASSVGVVIVARAETALYQGDPMAYGGPPDDGREGSPEMLLEVHHYRRPPLPPETRSPFVSLGIALRF